MCNLDVSSFLLAEPESRTLLTGVVTWLALHGSGLKTDWPWWSGQGRSHGKQKAVQRLCCHCVTECAAENCAICLRKSFSGLSERTSGGVPIILNTFHYILDNEINLILKNV